MIMTSLAEKIVSFLTPNDHDPEDDINTDTVAKVDKPSGDSNETVYTVSELRSKTAPLLEDIDPAYAGKKVSRKSLDNIFNDDENAFHRDENSKVNFDESEISDEDEEEDDLSDEDLVKFKHSFTIQKQSIDEEEDDDDEEEKEEEDDDDNNREEEEENDDDNKEEEEENDDDNKEEEEDEESDESEDENCDDMVNKFSNIDVNSEIEKADAVKSQQELWNRLCECRIKLHKLLIIANKLPQTNYWKTLRKKGGKEISESINKGSNSVKVLLNNCLDLQEELVKQNPEANNLENSNTLETSDADDEEIPSDTDEEMDISQDKETSQSEKKDLKRKLKCEEYGEILTKRYKSFIPFRNFVIQKWDEKTKLSSGRITQKSFSSFESSAVKQIEQILQDENRLIKRTQLKRSLYRVLGKPDVSEVKSDEKPEKSKPLSKQDMLLRDYDPEIFDDDDFYRQLLKEVIESKSIGIDPAVLRKQMEIQSVRNKMKRKVDTKASKGRKIRYDVHPKLVNFMAPNETSTISDEARDNLLKCLFGRSFIKNA